MLVLCYFRNLDYQESVTIDYRKSGDLMRVPLIKQDITTALSVKMLLARKSDRREYQATASQAV